MKAVYTITAVVLAVGLTHAASAQTVLYDNGVTDTDGGLVLAYLWAADFTLGSATTVTGADGWFFFKDLAEAPAEKVFYWEILSNASDQPGSTLYSGTATATYDTWVDIGYAGADVYRYAFDLGVLPLSSGVFWLALASSPYPSEDISTDWASNYTSPFQGDQTRPSYVYYEGEGWDPALDPNGHEPQFRILGTSAVPEPVSLLLLASGLLAVGGVALRRRQT